MKILHVISSGGMYGAEAVILNLMRTLRNGPHTVALAVFSNSAQPNQQLYECAAAEGFSTFVIACRGQLDTSAAGALRALVEQTGSEVIHAHGYKADVYTYLAMRRSKAALVSTCHTWYNNDFAVRLYGRLDRWTLRSYTRVIAVSEEVRQRLLASGVSSERIDLIANGIDIRVAPRLPRAPGQPLRVGLVGRLAREKGIDLFLEAAARVLQELPSTQFVVAGDGPDRAELESRIRGLGIGTNARLLGRQDEMGSFYASLDLLVSSSRQEGMPMAILEGMANELPLIATAVGETPALVQHGRSGELVPANDVPALAQAIIGLLEDPMKRASYGRAACDRVRDEFSASRMSADYVRVYALALQQVRA